MTITANPAKLSFPAFAVMIEYERYDARDAFCGYSTAIIDRCATKAEADRIAAADGHAWVELRAPTSLEKLDAIEKARERAFSAWADEGERMRCMSPHELIEYVGQP